MSDPPPARPKPGSLRDRIAAFEQKPAPSPAPPPPRPKPGTLSKWAPKPASSPPPDNAASHSHSREGSDSYAGGMSAADAKSAIGAGGSLKERMAALQGMGAFGGGGGGGAERPPPPKGEKPKWKPPPVVQMSPPIGGEDDEDAHVPRVVSPPVAEAGEEAKEEEGEGEEKGEVDAEEEERQRRAAIAARMARLGGARVGMGPPVFGKKPTPPPKKPSLDVKSPERVVSPPAGESKPEERVSSPPVGEEHKHEERVSSPPAVAEPKPAAPEAPAVTTPADNATSPPPSMPIPAAPRRAAPPRRKTPAKPTPASTPSEAPAAPQDEVHAPTPGAMPAAEEGTQSVASALADKVADEEKEVVEPPKEHHVPVDEEEGTPVRSPSPEPTPVPVDEGRPDLERKGTVDVAAEVPVLETPAVTHEEQPVQRRRSDASDARPESPELADETLGDDEVAQLEAKDEEVPEVKREEEEAPVDQEEDEEARRKRIADKVAKMGGFNPFSAPLPPRAAPEPEADHPAQPVHEHHDAVAGLAHPTTEDEKELRDAVEEHEGLPVEDIERAKVAAQAADLEPEEVDAMTSGAPVDIDGAVSQSGLPVQVVTEEDEAQREEKEKFVGEMREREGDVKSPTLEVPPRPAVGRRGSSGSVRSYGVTTIGRGVDVEEDEDGPRKQHEDQPASPEDSSRPYHTLDSVPSSALPQSARPPQSGSSSLFSPRPPHVPQDGADEPLLEEGEGEYEEGEEEGEEEIPPPPPARPIMSPPPPPSRAPPPPAPVDEEEEEAPPLPEKRTSMPPPPSRAVPPPVEAEEVEDVEEEEAPPPPPPSAPHPSKRASVPPPSRAPPAPEPVEVEEDVPPPPPSAPRPSKRTSVPPPAHAPPPAPAVHDEPAQISDVPPPPPSAPRPSKRTSVPPPVRSPPPPAMHDEPAQIDEPPPPPIPTSRPSKRTSIPPPARAPPAHAPPNPHDRAQSPPARKPSVPAGWSPRGSLDESRKSVESNAPPSRPPPPPQSSEKEVLDDSDGDPIDPRFHSPPPRTNTLPTLVAPSSPPQPPQHEEAKDAEEKEEQEEDPEQARKRSIAERMAKLGGIRFGAPPPLPGARRAPAHAPPPPAETSDEPQSEPHAETEHGDHQPEEEQPQQPQEPEEEEDEQARRQRIAARLAASGGMRFGMLPGQMPAAAPRRRESSDDHQASPSSPPSTQRAPVRAPSVPHAAAPPVPRTAAPPVPHTAAPPVPHTAAPPVPGGARPPPSKPMPAPPPESEYEYAGTGTESEDGVHVEAEESEAEDVRHDEAAGYEYEGQYQEEPVGEEEEEEEEEAPPPPPRPATRAPPVPHGQTRKASTGSFETVAPPARPAMGHPQQSDFVMVDEEVPPPPPPARAPPARAAPPPAQAESSNQWELPAIPSGGLDMADTSAASDLSASMFSEDSTTYPGTDDAPSHLQPSHVKPIPESMTPDELRAVHASVGSKLAEAAGALLQRSKGTLVGNGSYAGFVAAALAHVPHARPPAPGSTQYGFCIYHQVAATVHTRAAEILPGDVIVLVEARLKGHKGLHGYSLSVGEGAACVGVVLEFEGRKAKVRAAQANQHVGQATVESVSYRLEDLKSGSITIYRVLEA